MVKVQCKVCSETGYTASPDYVVCKCGGRFKVIQEHAKSMKIECRKATELLDTLILVK